MINKRSYYSDSFKIEVVKDVLEGKYTKEEAKKIHGIRSNCAVLYWIRKFSGIENYREPSEFEPRSTAMNKHSTEKKDLSKIKKLEEDLAREKQRAELWKKMVEIAEEELGIEIRKKFGARQFSELKKKAEKR